jgi:hypothetical protein
MCEESELSELSPERAEPAIGDSGSRKMCVISVVRGCLACSILYKGAAELCGRRINLRLIR